ncbi:MAG: tetratricopeptide repeat protein [Thermodesulfovibrionales bacterium]|nr:tetratricopeptide repeat protein [Thermodesulfovibrionales bacterium]
MNINKALDSALDLLQQGNLKQAKIICKKILKRKPDHADALHLLGMIYSEAGEYDQAITYIKKALQSDQNFAEAFNNLGNIFQKTKFFDEAIGSYQKAIGLNPNLSETYFNLGIVLQDKGKIDEAIDSYRKVTELKPDHFGAYNNLGLALQQQGKLDKAIACYQKALQINPQFADAYNNLGNAYKNKGQRDDAKSSYQKAITLNPNFAEAFNNLGILMKEEGYLDDAITSYQKALGIKADYVEAYNNMGAAYHAKGHLGQAISCYQKAMEIDAHYVPVYNNLGNALKDAGNLHEAERYFRRTLEIQSDYNVGYSNILFTMTYDDKNNPKTVFSEHIKFAEQFERPLIAHRFPHLNESVSDRRLRVGYVSPDFRTHSVGYFIEPVLSAHTHTNFEIFCYADVVNPDEVTKRIQGYTDHWLSIVGKPDEDVAELIREHRIDILVDLTGHTGHNRMLLFARKPAPIQVSWIGYPATTGLSAIDYKIVDTYTDPPGLTDHFYTEELIRMPECFLCYLPPAECPDKIADPPVLSAGHICFGSFNNFSKISAKTVEMWAQILQAVPDASLLLKAKCFADEQTRQHAKKLFSLRNIDIGRIEFLPWEPSSLPHLSLYNRIDIALDTFPYNGTTTTCEALWMGVPVITLAGNTHASRVGVSLLSNVGLPELIAKTEYEYSEIALNLSHDIRKLNLLRNTLRNMMASSPLMDSKKFIQYLEKSYHDIWADYCIKTERGKNTFQGIA